MVVSLAVSKTKKVLRQCNLRVVVYFNTQKQYKKCN